MLQMVSGSPSHWHSLPQRKTNNPSNASDSLFIILQMMIG